MLTIAQGFLRGKKIPIPNRDLVRPMGQRMREMVFNILHHRCGVIWENTVVLDSFAGSGSLGLEALSRGAARVFFLDILLENVSNIKAIIDTYKLNALSLCANTTQPFKLPTLVNVSFVDPPFGADVLEKGVRCAAQHMTQDGVMVIQKPTEEAMFIPPGWELCAERTYTYKQVYFLQRTTDCLTDDQ